MGKQTERDFLFFKISLQMKSSNDFSNDLALKWGENRT